MKVGIVTMHHVYNCGSYLQAYALYRVLISMGYDVWFVKNKQNLKSRLAYRLLQTARFVCMGKAEIGLHLLKVYRNFHRAQRVFPVTANIRNMDTVVYGSDTIWNIEQDYFLRHWKRFFGQDYDGKKVGYAVSIGSADAESLCDQELLCNAVAAFDTVMVRDTVTRDFVKKCCGENVDVPCVLDPTMLLTKEDYRELAPTISMRQYILFYFFGTVPEAIKRQVQDFAVATNRKIVVFGQKQDWADVSVSNDPLLMLSYYMHADYVITNTFHGNVFSIIFNKQFISLGREKRKVCDLLSRFDLTHRLVEEDDCIAAHLNQSIDFTAVNQKAADAIVFSKKQLFCAMKQKDNNNE